MNDKSMTRKRLSIIQPIVAQLICGVILILEFALDFVDEWIPIFTEPAHTILEILEIISVIVLCALSFFVLRYQRLELHKQQRQIRSLTLDFSVLIGESLAEYKLTKSEREVAWLSIKGYSNKEIAQLRKVSEPTIKKHLSTIYEKYDVNNRSEFLCELLDKVLDAKQ